MCPSVAIPSTKDETIALAWSCIHVRIRMPQNNTLDSEVWSLGCNLAEENYRVQEDAGNCIRKLVEKDANSRGGRNGHNNMLG